MGEDYWSIKKLYFFNSCLLLVDDTDRLGRFDFVKVRETRTGFFFFVCSNIGQILVATLCKLLIQQERNGL
jgi:hypothetical protein